MSRVIKFRAWDGKTMHTDVSILYEWGAIKYGYTGSPWLETAKAGTPMQFTGLHDNRGKEIYEGDIVDVHIPEYEDKGEVVFLEAAWQFGVLGSFDDLINERVEYQLRGLPCSVIGNIYENPELLERKK